MDLMHSKSFQQLPIETEEGYPLESIQSNENVDATAYTPSDLSSALKSTDVLINEADGVAEGKLWMKTETADEVGRDRIKNGDDGASRTGESRVSVKEIVQADVAGSKHEIANDIATNDVGNKNNGGDGTGTGGGRVRVEDGHVQSDDVFSGEAGGKYGTKTETAVADATEGVKNTDNGVLGTGEGQVKIEESGSQYDVSKEAGGQYGTKTETAVADATEGVKNRDDGVSGKGCGIGVRVEASHVHDDVSNDAGGQLGAANKVDTDEVKNGDNGVSGTGGNLVKVQTSHGSGEAGGKPETTDEVGTHGVGNNGGNGSATGDDRVRIEESLGKGVASRDAGEEPESGVGSTRVGATPQRHGSRGSRDLWVGLKTLRRPSNSNLPLPMTAHDVARQRHLSPDSNIIRGPPSGDSGPVALSLNENGVAAARPIANMARSLALTEFRRWRDWYESKGRGCGTILVVVLLVVVLTGVIIWLMIPN